MISQTNPDFWVCYHVLPDEIQRAAREKFRLWQSDAFNAALHFKPLMEDVWSVRVNQNYRALGHTRSMTNS